MTGGLPSPAHGSTKKRQLPGRAEKRCGDPVLGGVSAHCEGDQQCALLNDLYAHLPHILLCAISLIEFTSTVVPLLRRRCTVSVTVLKPETDPPLIIDSGAELSCSGIPFDVPSPLSQHAHNPYSAPVGRYLCTALLTSLTRLLRTQSPTVAVSTDNLQSLVVDVRTPEEYASGHIPNSINIPHTEIATWFENELSDRSEQPIVLYCRTGTRSEFAKRELQRLGHSRVTNFGGINRWNGPLSKP